MCYKKEDYIDQFSVQSFGSSDSNFPDLLCEGKRNGLQVWECLESRDLGVLTQSSHRLILHLWQDKPLLGERLFLGYKASNLEELHEPDSHRAQPLTLLPPHQWAARASWGQGCCWRGVRSRRGHFLPLPSLWPWAVASLLGPGNCSVVLECLCSMSGSVKLLGASKNEPHSPRKVTLYL